MIYKQSLDIKIRCLHRVFYKFPTTLEKHLNAHVPKEKDSMTSPCLDRKEEGCAT